ncbi:probable receptor-like protein kinase At5g61350 [Brassica rapa]|uniref:Protein kinase domain-containing protein n=1 Tax=Brassica campestris TaxID=3711 RepID=M4F4D4_BRACM|nr:probable receptor-like protein kinase At5g61350 [Brassica rapa]XP_033135273.1 probable receptor-like protein kinase At5g61350 [Brassica rapa]
MEEERYRHLLLLLIVSLFFIKTHSSFTPSDNYLINCGSSAETKLPDGRTFKSDQQSVSFLQTEEDIKTSVDTIPASDTLPLYLTARIFPGKATYSFYISRPGRHWIRLHFYPLPHPLYNLTDSVFSVTTDTTVLLHDFSATNPSSVVFKEYLVYASEKLSLYFKPHKGSIAFINAVEIISVPDELVPDSASSVPQSPDFKGLSSFSLQVSHRLNIGGDQVSSKIDPLSRTWLSDKPYNSFPEGTRNVTVDPKTITYPEGGATELIAPNPVYASAAEMADAQTSEPNFNLSWSASVDSGHDYFIRLHFCDVVSKSLNELVFNVFINKFIAISGLDLSTKTNALGTAYYADFVLNASAITNGTILVQVGPTPNLQSGKPNAILNGLEIMKLNNAAGSLDGLFGVDGKYRGPSIGMSSKKLAIAGIGFVMGLTAFFGVVVLLVRWQRRPKDWQKQNSFSSWLLPLHAGHSSFMSSKGGSTTSRKMSIFGSKKSKSNGFSSFFSNQGLGRYFPFTELQTATQNFDEKSVIGVGGFGKVYIGEIDGGTQVAIKRGNQSSEQGINEFQTEIQMLSKLRHRHLVSLIGFCDENKEMILVYEYMSNGPLRDHLYGSKENDPNPIPTLSWKQRLEICIGSARGLHYLHTGAAQGIIHRDVKTTNILLDENLVAKVSDFGLSKDAPMEQGHVSTAVKGSFGYLDPEYFRRQQLTDKSDVYSFGVVLFEVLCARPVINPQLPREQVNLAEYAMNLHRKGKLETIIDPKIVGTISKGSLRKFVEAAEKCLAEYGVDRPGMGDVLWNLEYALQLQEASAQVDLSEDKSTMNIQVEFSGEDMQSPPHPLL